jgi:hypothetical protein
MYLTGLPDFAVARHQEMLAAAAQARRVHHARGGRPHAHAPRMRLRSATVTRPRQRAGRAGVAAIR